MSAPKVSEPQRIFEKASEIALKEIPLHERGTMPLPGWWLRRKLKHAAKLFEKVLQTHPDNWASMWFLGMIHRRFRDNDTALSWFERAYQVNPSQTEIARQGSMVAMDLGKHDLALAMAWRAVQIEPQNYGLHANLALAYLLAGKTSDAKRTIDEALAGDPSDKVTQTVGNIINYFAINGITPPGTTPELTSYWSKNRQAQTGLL